MSARAILVVTGIGLAAAVLSACVAGDPQAGAAKAVVCQTCHGPGGNSSNPAFPRLAGQHRDYLVQALSEYQSGARKNAIMAGFAGPLSHQDMLNLASYFAAQRPSLYVR